jgi:hypothetical protein
MAADPVNTQELWTREPLTEAARPHTITKINHQGTINNNQ